MTEFRAFVVVGAVLALLFTAAAAGVFYQDAKLPAFQPAIDSGAMRVTGPHHPPKPYTSAQWKEMCEGVEVAPARCELGALIDCPPDCDLYAEAVARASVRRVW